MSEWAIQYLRPDGWWQAGTGWKERNKAIDAAEAYFANYTGRSWRVVEKGSPQDHELCDEAIKELGVQRL